MSTVPDGVHPGGTVVMIFGAPVLPDGGPGPAMRRRVAAALAWTRDEGKGEVSFLVTGGPVFYPTPESEVMAAMLRNAGIPANRIVQEESAYNTFQSVWRSLPLLEAMHPAAIVACTDDFHLPRCRWLFRLAGLRTLGISARSERFRKWPRVREVMALPVDTLRWIFTR